MTWISIEPIDWSDFNVAEILLHQAAQFPAMFGKNYLPQQEDDSNTNLGWDSRRIISREHQDVSVAVDVETFQFEVWKSGVELASISMEGRTKQVLFDELKSQIDQARLLGSRLKYMDHYELPDHEIDHGAAFTKPDQAHLDQWIDLRCNAVSILDRLNEVIGQFSEIRIWPHHFDTGTYYPLAEKQAIGAGWAIADTVAPEPYLYIYGWNGDRGIDFSNVPELQAGKWMFGDWKGAILPVSEIVVLDDQEQAIDHFLTQVARFFKSALGR